MNSVHSFSRVFLCHFRVLNVFVFVIANMLSVGPAKATTLRLTGIDNEDRATAFALSGSQAIGGANRLDRLGENNQVLEDAGAAYVFQALDANQAAQSQTLQLIPPAPVEGVFFGGGVDLSGNFAIVTSRLTSNNSGAIIHFFEGLDSATGTLKPVAQLGKKDGGTFRMRSFSIEGRNVAVTEMDGSSCRSGSAYIFLDVQAIDEPVEPTVMLLSDDLEFGDSISMSGNAVLVGATQTGSSICSLGSGRAYFYTDLDSGDGEPDYATLLEVSNGRVNDQFGSSLELDGMQAIVGAPFRDPVGTTHDNFGYAFYFKDLDGSTTSKTESSVLFASDAAIGDQLGSYVRLSGNHALASAPYADISGISDVGAVYLYTDLASMPYQVSETVKIIPSVKEEGRRFGGWFDLDGETFLISNFGGEHVGVLGTVSSITTLDEGAGKRLISGYGFHSRDDWVIGAFTDGNEVTLGVEESAEVIETGKAIYIGKNANADNNRLVIEGTLTATEVYIGSVEGNFGNELQFESSASVDVTRLRLAVDNALTLFGDYTVVTDLLNYLGGAVLQVWNGVDWLSIDAVIAEDWITVEYSEGYTTIQPNLLLPEIELQEAFGTMLVRGSIVDFGVVPVGDSASFDITIHNRGNATLEIFTIAISEDVGFDFSSTSMGPVSIIPGEQFSLEIVFSAEASGSKRGTLTVSSNDPVASEFQLSLIGQAISSVEDSDSDGMNDVSEFRLEPLGFDWEVEQIELVELYFAEASNNGLYLESELQALALDRPLIGTDPVSGELELILNWQSSVDLETFFDFPVTSDQVSVLPDGKLRIVFPFSAGPEFYRLDVR